MPIAVRAVLHETHERITFASFPLSGVIAMIATGRQ